MKPISALIVLSGLLTSLSPALEINSPTPDRHLVYKSPNGVDLKLHIFEPEDLKAGDKRSAIVFFFGGGWTSGSPKQFYPQSRYLADKGMVAMSAEYRVNSRHKTTPVECVKDGKSAVRWIRKHAEELGIDPDKLAAGGGSAGGHVAATTGTTTAFNDEQDDPSISCTPNALVLFNPVCDNSPEGYGYSRVSEYWKQISPMHNLHAGTPPTIVFLGTRDKLIPVETAKAYQKKMQDLGVRSDLHLYEGQPHGFFNKSKSPESHEDTTQKMEAFLQSLGFL